MNIFTEKNIYNNSLYINQLDETIVQNLNSNNNDNNNNLILNVKDNFIKYVKIGKYVICQILKFPLINHIKKNIYLFTNFKEWLILEDKTIYTIEYKNNLYNVWFCKIIDYNIIFNLLNTIIDHTILKNITQQNLLLDNIKKCRIINARCDKSMYILDDIHRNYIKHYKINKKDTNKIISIKSVAGSGKTTTLLNLAKNNKDKNILYIAFNKNLVEEIKDKLKIHNITNLQPHTFDSLMRKCYLHNTNQLNLIHLKPFNLQEYIPWFKNKKYALKKNYISKLDRFCNQIIYNDIEEFSKFIYNKKDNLLKQLWEKINNNDFQTFNTIRKLIQINHLCKSYIDQIYDSIFIDEAQDFDMVMLKILLEDSTINKIFVGDPKQAIYEWRGCINAFNNLPSNTLNIEFYSTFRIGYPACNSICDKISNLYMFSKSTNHTILEYNIIPKDKYVYLFRTWKELLTKACTIKNIWIYNYNKQRTLIQNLHEKLLKFKLTDEEQNEFSDDLPAFLNKLSSEDLLQLLNNIENNLVSESKALCKMYTIHSFKGLEDNIIKIANDININTERNLYYVSLTRGLKQIIIDNIDNIDT